MQRVTIIGLFAAFFVCNTVSAEKAVTVTELQTDAEDFIGEVVKVFFYSYQTLFENEGVWDVVLYDDFNKGENASVEVVVDRHGLRWLRKKCVNIWTAIETDRQKKARVYCSINVDANGKVVIAALGYRKKKGEYVW